MAGQGSRKQGQGYTRTLCAYVPCSKFGSEKRSYQPGSREAINLRDRTPRPITDKHPVPVHGGENLRFPLSRVSKVGGMIAALPFHWVCAWLARLSFPNSYPFPQTSRKSSHALSCFIILFLAKVLFPFCCFGDKCAVPVLFTHPPNDGRETI